MITHTDKVMLVERKPGEKSISQKEFDAINKIQTWTHLDDSFWPVVLHDDSIVWDEGEGKPSDFLTGMEWMVDGLYYTQTFEPHDNDDADYLKEMRDTFLGILDRLGIPHEKEFI